MPTYRVTAPDGRVVRLTGNSPPTDDELEQVFASLPPASGQADAPERVLEKQAPATPAVDVGSMLEHPISSSPSGVALRALGAGKAIDAAENFLRTNPSMAIQSAVARGAIKGAANTVAGLGRMVAGAGGFGEMDPTTAAALQPSTWGLDTKGVAEGLGSAGEQAAEFFAIPGPGKMANLGMLARMSTRALTQGVPSALLARAQGASGVGSGVVAGLATVPVLPAALNLAAKATQGIARRMALSALKPSTAILKGLHGEELSGIGQRIDSFADFILDNKITTPEKAQAILKEAEDGVQRAIAGKNIPTDATSRAALYVDELVKSARRAGPDALKGIQAAWENFNASPIGESVYAGLPMKPTAAQAAELAAGRKVLVHVPASAVADDLAEVGSRAKTLENESRHAFAAQKVAEGNAKVSEGAIDAQGRLTLTDGRHTAAAAVEAGHDVIPVLMSPKEARSLADVALPESRQLRQNIPADEALATAREWSRNYTAGKWAPGNATEASRGRADKQIELAMRDAVKASVPETAPLLAREGMAISARKAMENYLIRTGKLDPVGLQPIIAATPAMSRGKIPLVGAVLSYLREQSLPIAANVMAPLSKALQSGNAAQLAFILHKLGIAVPPRLMRAQPEPEVR
jgi:hypothetical protein